MTRRATTIIGGVSLLCCFCLTGIGIGQPGPAGKGEAALGHAAATGKSTYLLFYRTWDGAATAMAHALKTHADKNVGQTFWTSVNVADPAERALVERFQLSRAPTPLVLTVHPNGAITGAFVNKVAEPELVSSLVSPVKAECLKLLQQNQIVLLCLQSAPQQTVPSGVRQFQADPHYVNRTKVIRASLSDPHEAAFYKGLQLDAGTPATIMFAPPGVVVGKFAANASMNDMAKALHAAGKCCDDPNCKHNH